MNVNVKVDIPRDGYKLFPELVTNFRRYPNQAVTHPYLLDPRFSVWIGRQFLECLFRSVFFVGSIVLANLLALFATGLGFRALLRSLFLRWRALTTGYIH
jgi:hypothetical protein